MKPYIIVFFLFIVVACNPQKEEVFSKMQEIDYPTDAPFSIGDYKSSVYFIEYNNSYYQGWIHPDSSSFSKLWRFYTEEERDSLGLEEGKDYLVENMSLDNPLTHELEKLCQVFKSVWRIDPKSIYLLNITVDENHLVWLTIRWKRTGEDFVVLVSDNYNKAFQHSSLARQTNNFIKINPNLYYRNLQKE